MAMVMFFPWLEIGKNFECGEFSLLSYVRGAKPGPPPVQQPLDVLLDPYRDNLALPTQCMTLMKFRERDLFDDIDEDDRERAFEFRQFLALTAISNRQLFARGEAYVNADSFQLLIQRFDTAHATPSVVSRKRDGTRMVAFLEGTFVHMRPLHVPSGSAASTIDITFLEALCTCPDLELKRTLHNATLSFLAANSDASHLSERDEVVHLVSAFEHLLSDRPGKEDALAQGMGELWQPQNRIPIAGCPRIPRDWGGQKSAKSQQTSSRHHVSDVWVRDFFRTRNDFAHGGVTAGRKPIWSPFEHLLLGSHVFPLATKVLLSNAQAYTLSADDLRSIDVFEKLACADLLTPLDQHRISWPWHQIMRT